MADNNTKVQGLVEIKDNSAERVAFDLMTVIANKENPAMGNECQARRDSNRLYYLNLYTECLNAVKHQQVPESDSSLG